MGSIFQDSWHKENTIGRIRYHRAKSDTVFQHRTLLRNVRHCQIQSSSNSFDAVSLYHTVSRAGKCYFTASYESVLILTILHHIVSWVAWGVFSTAGYSNNKRFSPHGTEHPPQYSWYPPRASWYPPTVLNIPHGTQDNPTWYSWYPPRYKISPMFFMISLTVLNTPHSTQDILPRYCTHIIQGDNNRCWRQLFPVNDSFWSTTLCDRQLFWNTAPTNILYCRWEKVVEKVNLELTCKSFSFLSDTIQIQFSYLFVIAKISQPQIFSDSAENPVNICRWQIWIDLADLAFQQTKKNCQCSTIKIWVLFGKAWAFPIKFVL